MAAARAFSGLRVFDATMGVAGPHGTMLLALQGADVIKIEPPFGDWGREIGQTSGSHSAHSIAFNRGKRSIAIDLKSDDGQRVARKLAEQSDVVVESFRPGVMARLGLGYDALKANNQKVIYCSVTGFGQTGPNSQLPIVDMQIQAFSGMMVMNQSADGSPQNIKMVAVDVLTGLYVYHALSGAIVRQSRFGEGAYLDVSMMQSAAAFQAAGILQEFMGKGNPTPLHMPRGVLNTADGQIALNSLRDADFERMCVAMGRTDLVADARFAKRIDRGNNAAALMTELRGEFVKRTTAEWLQLLRPVEVMIERVQRYTDWLDDPHVKAVSAYDLVDHPDVEPIPIVNSPGLPGLHDEPVAAVEPDIGEHTEAVLQEIGYSDAEIESLIRSKAVARPG